MLFYELLQVALGNLDRLGSSPSDKEWAYLFEESTKQAVTGILLHGIDRLPMDQRPPQAILFRWIAVGQMIEQQNHLMDERCEELIGVLKDAGLHVSIIKGQGIARLYNEELQSLRQSGDIDVYVGCGLNKTLAFAKSRGQEELEWDYKHLHLKKWNDTEVEIHYRVEVLLNLWKNIKLQKWFHKHQDAIWGSRFKVHDSEIVTPSVEFNVFYILLHIYRHFLYEGVGMRQIIDYYMVLRAVHDSGVMVHDYIETVRKYGLNRFAKGLMWVMKEILGMPRDWLLWEPEKKEGEYILSQVMKGGNFGHHDMRLQHGRGKIGAVKSILKHNCHLLWHYPADIVWTPVWIVWHKLWKIKTGLIMRR